MNRIAIWMQSLAVALDCPIWGQCLPIGTYLATHLATVLGTRRTKNTQGRVNERYGLIM